MVQAAQITLKVIVGVHFVLTTWAAMTPSFLPPAYLYMNFFILAFGIWAIACPDAYDPVLMFAALNAVAIVMDMIFLGIFQPLGHGVYEGPDNKVITKHTYRFSLGMCIVNLIVRPFTCFVMYRIYQDRGGQYSDFGFPGVPGFGNTGKPGGYENIDQPVPSNNVESASPHSTLESPRR